MWHDLKKAVVNDDLNGRQSRGDQGASSAATKSCHGDKNCLTTPLTTYRKFYREVLICKAFSFLERNKIRRMNTLNFFGNYAMIIITILKWGERCGGKEGKAICER